MNFIQQWLDKKRKVKEDLKAKEIENFLNAKKEEEERQNQIILDAIAKIDKEKDKELKESNKPWFKLEILDEDPVKGLRSQWDWNPAFVRCLVKNGFQGDDEAQLVQRFFNAYVSQLYTDASDERLNKFKE